MTKSTDRQTGQHTDRWTDREADAQIDGQTERRTHRPTDGQTDRHIARETDRRKYSLNVESYDGTLIVECLVDDSFEAARRNMNHLTKPLQGTSRQRLFNLYMHIELLSYTISLQPFHTQVSPLTRMPCRALCIA